MGGRVAGAFSVSSLSWRVDVAGGAAAAQRGGARSADGTVPRSCCRCTQVLLRSPGEGARYSRELFLIAGKLKGKHSLKGKSEWAVVWVPSWSLLDKSSLLSAPLCWVNAKKKWRSSVVVKCLLLQLITKKKKILCSYSSGWIVTLSFTPIASFSCDLKKKLKFIVDGSEYKF